MKYKFIYSLSFFALYGSTGGFLLATWRSSVFEASLFLLSAYLFYFVAKNWIYYAKEWIKSSTTSLILLFIALFFVSPFLAFGIGASYLAATFIQVYLDEMCRSKGE